MLLLQNLSYYHPNKKLLFEDLNLTLATGAKAPLIGNNGVGKSTLLRIISGELQASSGTLLPEVQPYVVPQLFGQYNHLTIAQALGIAPKLAALKAILAGDVTEQNLAVLDEDWTIEERCNEALQYWHLSHLDLEQKLETLSGGQKQKCSWPVSPFTKRRSCCSMNPAIIWIVPGDKCCMILFAPRQPRCW